jgi:hypothetical protein
MTLSEGIDDSSGIDTEPFHVGDKRCTFQPETSCGAVKSTDTSASFFECLHHLISSRRLNRAARALFVGRPPSERPSIERSPVF